MSELYGIWVISQYSCRFFNGRIIALQRCAGFCHMPTWTCHRSSDAPPSWTSLPLPPYPIPRGCHSSRHHTANSHWLSVLHMVKYMFQCCSLNSFHTLKAVNFKKKKKKEKQACCSLYLFLIFCFCVWYGNMILELSSLGFKDRYKKKKQKKCKVPSK